MWARSTPLQKLGYVALACMFFFVAAFIGRTKVEPKPDLVLTPVNELPSSTPIEPAKPQPPTVPAELAVHVAGAVTNPGLYKLATGARVQDAIDMAGGLAKDALTEEINLAAKLEDGTQLFVPRASAEPALPDQEPILQKDEQIARVEPQYKGASAPKAPYSRPKQASRPKAEAAPAGPVNINTAGKSQLESLPGIGPVTADRIIEYRKMRGGFGSVEELLEVKGIGPKKMEKLRGRVKL